MKSFEPPGVLRGVKMVCVRVCVSIRMCVLLLLCNFSFVHILQYSVCLPVFGPDTVSVWLSSAGSTHTSKTAKQKKTYWKMKKKNK